jgi:hypothetical protein
MRLAFAGLAVFVLLLGSAVWGQAPAPQPIFSLPQVGRLPEKRMMHGCAVVGKRMYVMGGHLETQNNANLWANDVKSAEIQANGRIDGPWRREPDLPTYMAYLMQAVQVVNNRIYIIGANTFANPTADENTTKHSQEAVWTTVGSDGVLSPWRKSVPFPGEPLSFTATCSSEKNLFIMGGTGQAQVLDQMLIADIAEDGTPGNWRTGTKLPVPLWFHGSALLDNRIYVWGGLPTTKSDTVNTSIFSAPVSEKGEIGAWRRETTAMPTGMYSSAFCGFNDYLICVAGRVKDAQPVNVIWFTRLASGQPGAWQSLNTDLQARIYHPVGLDKSRGWVYVVGGLDRRQKALLPCTFLDTIQAFQLTQPTESKLVVSEARGGSTAQPEVTAATALSLEAALPLAQQQGRKVLVLFYSPQVPACKRLWDSVIMSPGFKELVKDRFFAVVDVSGPGVSTCYKYSVFKVPAMIEVNGAGEALRKVIRLGSLDDLAPLR